MAAMGTLGTCPDFLYRAALAADERSGGARPKTLVCVFQRGAADGLSMVVPYGDPLYYRHRSELAIARPARSGGNAETALDLDGYFGLHPAMSALLPLYKRGTLAAIHACGSPNPSRSHFDMQDYMESAAPGNKSIQSGWLNRLLMNCPEDRTTLRATNGHPSPFRAISMTPTVPRMLQGEADALAIRDLATFGMHGGNANGAAAGATSGFEGMYDGAVGDVLRGTGRESFDAMSMLKNADPAKYRPVATADYPADSFGRALTQVAQLIKADVGLRVACVEVEGWDTHVNQGGASGQLAGRLHDFARGLAAFCTDLGDRLADVLLLTMSEFGRAARQNGNRGTDHGHGTCFLALGGPVRGGRVLGDWPTLAPEKLFEERDLAVTTDFRDVFGEACFRHFGAGDDALAKIFPGYRVDAARFRGICGA